MNKIKFILPKLLGVTVLAGVATFILATVFKLLFAGLLLTGIAAVFMKIAGKKRGKMMIGKFGNGALPEYFGRQKDQVFSQVKSEKLAIIPIH